ADAETGDHGGNIDSVIVKKEQADDYPDKEVGNAGEAADHGRAGGIGFAVGLDVILGPVAHKRRCHKAELDENEEHEELLGRTIDRFHEWHQLDSHVKAGEPEEPAADGFKAA